MGALLAHHGLLLSGGGGGGATDPDFASRVALLHFDGADGSTTFTDVKGKTWTRTGAPEIDTAQSLYGGASMLVPGGASYLSTPSDADFDFGTGDFIFEFAVRWGTSNQYRTPFSRGYTTGAGAILLQTSTTSGRALRLYIGGSTICTESSGGADGTWHQYEVNRVGTTCRIFRAGVQTASGTSSANITHTAPMYIGGSPGGTGIFSIEGHMDEMRITKGVAGHTSNFTPPSAAFPDS